MAVERPPFAIELPGPKTDGTMPLEQSLLKRRSVRSFQPLPLTLEQVAQLMWATQGVSSSRGDRTAPSAGATYPLEIYVAAGDVDGLAPGIYRYRPREHDMIAIREGDMRDPLTRASLRQGAIRKAPAYLS